LNIGSYMTEITVNKTYQRRRNPANIDAEA